jgi:hypothetical protein
LGDEYFVSEQAGRQGVRVVNMSSWEDFIFFQHFGPNNPEVPGAWNCGNFICEEDRPILTRLLHPEILDGLGATGHALRKGDAAGFFLGLWQGIISPVTFVDSLFTRSVRIYEVHNNGGWHNLGFLLGLSIIFGGGAGGTSRGLRRRSCGSSARC